MASRASKKFLLWLTGISIVAGVLYSSWPLGYWLNPVVNKDSLASGLEAAHQPYNWVFIGGDVSSSLLMIIVCWLLWKYYLRSRPSRLFNAVLIGVVIFSAGTIADALLPERCIPGLQVCPNFEHSNLLLFHGIFSIGASVSLFASLCFVWWRERQSVLLNSLMLGYILFGFISLIEAITPGKDGNWSQHYYITLCSVSLALIPYLVLLGLQVPAVKDQGAQRTKGQA